MLQAICSSPVRLLLWAGVLLTVPRLAGPARAEGEPGQPMATPAPGGPGAGAQAGAEEPRAPIWTYGGSASSYFSSNVNNPFDARNGLRALDYRDEHGAHLSLIDVWVERTRAPVGFRLDLDWGPAAGIQNALEPSDDDILEHIQQAYLSVNLDRKGATYLDLGKWITPAGAEVVEPVDNVLYSQGLLFSLAVPYFHFGGRLFRYFNDEDYVMVHVNRGWDAVSYPGHGPGFGISGSKALGKELTLTGNYLGGDENAGSTGWRSLFDLVALYTPAGKASYTFNFDYGSQASARLGHGRRGPATWYGAMGIAKYTLGKRHYAAARAEWLRDDAGFLTGDDTDLYSVALNYTRTLSLNVQVRLEYRHDFAARSRPFATDRPGRPTADQGTFLIGGIVSY